MMLAVCSESAWYRCARRTLCDLVMYIWRALNPAWCMCEPSPACPSASTATRCWGAVWGLDRAPGCIKPGRVKDPGFACRVLGVDGYLADAFASSTPRGFEHDRVADLGAALPGLLQGVDACLHRQQGFTGADGTHLDKEHTGPTSAAPVHWGVRSSLFSRLVG